MKKSYIWVLVIFAAGVIFLIRSSYTGGLKQDRSQAQGGGAGNPGQNSQTVNPGETERRKKEAKENYRDRVAHEDIYGIERPPVPFRLVGQGGQVPSATAEAAKLTPEERQEVNLIVGNTFKTYLDSTITKATFNPSESDKENKIAVFDTPADPDLGESRLLDLKAQLNAAVGDEKAAILMQAFSLDDVYGYFGRENIKLRFDYANEDPEKQVVKIEYFSTVSGNQVARTETNKVQFMQRFGAELPPIPQG